MKRINIFQSRKLWEYEISMFPEPGLTFKNGVSTVNPKNTTPMLWVSFVDSTEQLRSFITLDYLYPTIAERKMRGIECASLHHQVLVFCHTSCGELVAVICVRLETMLS